MRTNTIDATAFRCLAQYNTLIDIYSKLYEEDYDDLIKEYLDELINFDTAKEVREKHTERMSYIKDKINEKIDEIEPLENKVIKPQQSVNFKIADGRRNNNN